MGVSMLPRLAATVCIQTTGTASRRPGAPSPDKTEKVKGTKVSSETSLVMTMLPKKHSPTSSQTSASSPRVRPSSARPSRSNTPCRRSPAITAISANRTASVRRSR